MQPDFGPDDIRRFLSALDPPPGGATWVMVTVLDGKRIAWLDGTEGTGRRVCSVYDPESHEPPRRRMRDGEDWAEEPCRGAPEGLTIYGAYKWDRPTFQEFVEIEPHFAYLIEGVLAGLGHTSSPQPRTRSDQGELPEEG